MAKAGVAAACVHSREAGKAYRDVRLFKMGFEALSQALEDEFAVHNADRCAIGMHVDLARRRRII
jgi:hypothetical protein